MVSLRWFVLLAICLSSATSWAGRIGHSISSLAQVNIPCADGKILKRTSGAWTCEDDGVTDSSNFFKLDSANTLSNVAAPGNPAAGKTVIWTDATDKNLKIKDDTGNVTVSVKSHTGAANSFVSAIAANGTVSIAQPSFANLSGAATDAQVPNNITVDLAAAVTTNANLTGPITSVGNATSVAAQTGTGSTFVMNTNPTIAGGAHTALTGFGVRSTGTGAFDLKIANAENLTVADKTLTIALGDANRTLTLGASPSVSGSNTGDQTITLTGDVTGTGNGSFATTIANDAVTYAKMQNVSATSRFLGRITAAAGDTEELTGTQATTLLDNFTSTLKGLAPSSGGGTANFLRADGTWNAPGGGTTITTVRKTADEIVNNSTTLQNDDALFLAMAANETWYFTAYIGHIGSDTSADFKVAFTVPAGATIRWGCVNSVRNTATVMIVCPSITGSGAALSLDGSTDELYLVLSGAVVNGATAGNLQFQWAQNTATVIDTKVLTNSYLEAHK